MHIYHLSELPKPIINTIEKEPSPVKLMLIIGINEMEIYELKEYDIRSKYIRTKDMSMQDTITYLFNYIRKERKRVEAIFINDFYHGKVIRNELSKFFPDIEIKEIGRI